jgi:hypothetical protein
MDGVVVVAKDHQSSARCGLRTRSQPSRGGAVIKFKRQTLVPLALSALALSSVTYAATGGIPGPNQAPGRPSVVPPAISNAHCGKTTLRPPCKHYKG